MLSYPLWLHIAVLVLVYLTHGTHTTAVSLLDLMPKCSSQCLENFITTEYPRDACSTGCDLNYLCTTNTTSGYTLGEGALRCSLSMCSMEVAMSFDTYSICSGVPGALPRTHPTLVATITSPPDSTSTTRTTTMITTETENTHTRPTANPTSTEINDTTSTTTTFQSPISATEDPSSTETEQSTSTTSTTSSTSSDSSASATPSESSSASSSGGLDSGAVIGVSVVSGLAGFFILGVVIFYCQRRIRRRNAQDREFFEIGGHMSEPPDFSFPPRRPPMGPRPSPGTLQYDSESVRLVPPAEPEYQHPAVIVTEPEADHDYNNMRAGNADRAGYQSSSHLEFDAESVISSRTVSDLLPDKPTYELYPRPLRWSQHKKRPSSGSSFHEDDNRTGTRNIPSPSLQHFDFSAGTSRGQSRLPMAGLPANPRAMKYGFGRVQAPMPPKKGPQHGKKPVYTNVEENFQPRQAAIHATSPYPSGHTDYNDDIDNYWQNSETGFVGAKVIEPHEVTRGSYQSTGNNRNSFGDYPGYEFDYVDINNNYSGPEARQAPRHSGSFRPLTPVREVKTPTGELLRPLGESSHNGNRPSRHYPSGLSSEPLTQPQEIVSRPRIVRQDDIKRVQIRRGKPSPKEAAIPYCPDDYWLDQNNEPPSTYNAPRQSSEYKYISGGNINRMPKKKPAPQERNLTPSRRGADLILQVD
ncbi:hypothetical protein BJX99DRAFT_216912 [Aspergillus californicus]